MSDRLTYENTEVDIATLTDFYFVVVVNIENALLLSGAEPGKDYDMKDLFRLATSFVLDRWKLNKLELST